MTTTFPCRQCGAELTFSPGAGRLKCQYCGTENDPPVATAGVAEQDLSAWIEPAASETATEERLAVRCTACGAESSLGANTTAGRCPFCGTATMAGARSVRLIKPAGLLAFTVDRDRAFAAFRTWVRGLWFAPNALKRLAAQIGEMAGVYLPFWTFDCATTSGYSGRRGDDTHSTERVREGGRTVTRTVTHTSWTRVSGTVECPFDDVLVPATRSLPECLLAALEPWDLDRVVPYTEEYLAGFAAESYGVPIKEGWARAREIIDGQIRAAIARDIGGDHQEILAVDTAITAQTFKHLLLPVWISAYTFKDMVFRFVVNARTGEVQGERPWSWVKIAAAILAVVALLVAAALAKS